MQPVVDLNGELVAADEARVPTTDLGLLYGIGLFETMRAYGGRVFRLQQHLGRLLASAEKLSLPITSDILPDEKRFSTLLEKNGLLDARLRLTVTGGAPEEEATVRHTVLTTAVPVQTYPQAYYENGMTVLVSSQVQSSADPLNGHKTTCYWPRLQALHDAQVTGCGEALWFTEKKQLAEGSISNVFIVKNRVVKTPPLDTLVLPGITRAAVIELCQSEHISYEETPLTVNDLLDADEVFLTNCMMEVVPVCRVERRAIGSDKVGPMTARLITGYKELVEAECHDKS